jgi:hypothetical protein
VYGKNCTDRLRGFLEDFTDIGLNCGGGLGLRQIKSPDYSGPVN